MASLALDLTGPNANIQLMNFLDDLDLRPDSLINNARSLEYLRTESDGLVSTEAFQGEHQLNVVVPYQITMALLRQRCSRLSRVVNIASMYGLVAANPALSGS